MWKLDRIRNQRSIWCSSRLWKRWVLKHSIIALDAMCHYLFHPCFAAHLESVLRLRIYFATGFAVLHTGQILDSKFPSYCIWFVCMYHVSCTYVQYEISSSRHHSLQSPIHYLSHDGSMTAAMADNQAPKNCRCRMQSLNICIMWWLVFRDSGPRGYVPKKGRFWQR